MDKLEKVSLVRAKERAGLIRARLAGFDKCTADVAIFLDSHCEVTEGKSSRIDRQRGLVEKRDP